MYGGMGMGMGGYGGSMYGAGYGGGYGGGMYGRQQQPNQTEENKDPNAPYQFDLRRDLQSTVGGLNATLGLAFGLSSMASLGSVTLGQ